MTNYSYRPAYNLVRDMVSEHGGSMVYIKKGEGHDGSWLIKVAGKQTYFPVRGRRCPGIDELHVRKPGLITNTWNDFLNELFPNAWEILLGEMEQEVYYPPGEDDFLDVFLDDFFD